MTKHLELSVKINPVWSEYISEVLVEQVGCSGVVTETIEYEDEKVVKDENDIVKGYLWFNEDNPVNLESIKKILEENRNKLISSGIKADSLGSWTITTKEIADEAWAHNWKKFWHPQKIGSRIVICPSWEEYVPENNELIMQLDPGSAFGTGTHPTTRLCIMALEKYLEEGNTLADIGTGSGILAIAGAMFGASKVVGDDNDLSVIGVAKENAENNHVSDKCCFFEGSAADVKGEYDVVVANILANIIMSIMDDLYKITKTGGKIIFSGINIEKAEEVRQCAITKGFKVIETLEEDNWVAIIANK